MNIIIDPQEGLAVPEGKIATTVYWLIQQIKAGELVQPLGQNELIAGIRLAVRRKWIEPVVFVFSGLEFPLTAAGSLSTWPRGFPGDVLDPALAGER